MLFTTSWDDGHPDDLRLADLLGKHGIKGTFYVPITNREGLPTLDAAGLRALDAIAEIGAHTRDHVYADAVPFEVWIDQVKAGKNELEQILGHSVSGFCYPGGKIVPNAAERVKELGFEYARTTQNFHTQAGSDPHRIPTTLQFYPHSRQVLMRNFLKQGNYISRFSNFLPAMTRGTLQERLEHMLEIALHTNTAEVFHLWGHSWELAQLNLWPDLDNFLRVAAAHIPLSHRVDNAGIAANIR
ncbi:polysaccharide deacetylase family protein [Roseateles koreensis]|uniref:Polysaccharide deacetylase family protein n=1 Tax=Roseateles koreensis TaxID=2987526 RepID=A0ABT5KUR7_9BURK|nr:polysaccharide deacetylase family protein [Roseateles koreensis]MDC8786688.1 polysaccharide deacetylase family protein [Roseateles koreensis]